MGRIGLGIPKRSPRLDTSPLVEIYSGWEAELQSMLAILWREQSQVMSEHLRADAAGLVKNKEFWAMWGSSYLALLMPRIDTAATMGADIGAEILQTTWALGVDSDVYMPTVADWARKHSGKLAKGLTKTDKLLLRRYVAQYVESGDTLSSLITRVNSFVNNEPRARRIAVTEATGAFSEGNIAAWRVSEVVTGKIWEVARDEIVCPVCFALDGQISELDGQVWHHFTRPAISVGLSVKAPPIHPSCRCWTGPFVGVLPWLAE